MKHIVVIGGGFAGMWAALTAAREVAIADANIRVTLVARDEFLTVRPRLYEEFSAGLRAPLAPTLAPLGIVLQIGAARSIELDKRAVHVRDDNGHGIVLHYDRLVLAAGSEQVPLKIPGAAEYAQSIDTFGAAAAFDQHLRVVARAPECPGRLTFVVVGGGFTGIEIATEMRRRIQVHSDAATAAQARIILIERATVIGPELGANPRPTIAAALADAKVEIRTGCEIAAIEKTGIVLASGERIDAATVLLTVGLRANALASAAHAELDRSGRVIVNDLLQVKGASGLYAAGDIAHANADDEHVALMSCQHAVPMGKSAGYNAAHELLDLPLRPYSQPNYVTCLDLGSWGAMLTAGWDRQLQMAGAEAKALKRKINTEWIYPPVGTREAILAAADIDAPWPPV